MLSPKSCFVIKNEVPQYSDTVISLFILVLDLKKYNLLLI